MKNSAAGVSREDEIRDELLRLVAGGDELHARIVDLATKHGDTVFAELLFLLAHLRFPPKLAAEYWAGVLARQDEMRRQMGSPVDVRVALVSYFMDVNRKLRSPKIIELQLFQETEASVYRDDLTGLHNYRFFREQIAQEIERVERYGTPLSLVMIDIDDFKRYNDRYGHYSGNEALAGVASVIRGELRKTDTPVRYGGEEFALILVSTCKEGAQKVAERVRQRIAARRFETDRAGERRLTVSMGVATFPADADDVEGLVRNADNALYIAKSRGKNQVVLYGADRRSFRRIKANLDGSYCIVEDEVRPFTTLDVSEAGLLLLTDRKLLLGQLLDIKMKLPDATGPVGCAGRVVRVHENGSGRYEAGISIDRIGPLDRTRLVRFLRGEKTPITSERTGVA